MRALAVRRPRGVPPPRRGRRGRRAGPGDARGRGARPRGRAPARGSREGNARAPPSRARSPRPAPRRRVARGPASARAGAPPRPGDAAWSTIARPPRRAPARSRPRRAGGPLRPAPRGRSASSSAARVSRSPGAIPAPSRSRRVRAKASSHPGVPRRRSAGKCSSGRPSRKKVRSRAGRRLSSPGVASTPARLSTSSAATPGPRKRVPARTWVSPSRISARRRVCATGSSGTRTVRTGSGPGAGSAAIARAHSAAVHSTAGVVIFYSPSAEEAPSTLPTTLRPRAGAGEEERGHRSGSSAWAPLRPQQPLLAKALELRSMGPRGTPSASGARRASVLARRHVPWCRDMMW